MSTPASFAAEDDESDSSGNREEHDNGVRVFAVPLCHIELAVSKVYVPNTR